jgi:hypothetical protein
VSKPKQTQTLLERRVGWFSNHPVFSILILIVIIVGGLAGFTESAGKLVAMLRPTQAASLPAPITCTIRVSNPALKPRTIQSFTEFNLVQSGVISMRILAEGRVELISRPGSADPYTIPAGEFRDFQITMPKLPVYEAILEQGGANLHIPIRPTDSNEIALASPIFQRAALHKFYAEADLGEAKPTKP